MATPQPVSFFSLPPEVRDQIYTEVLVKPDSITVYGGVRQRTPVIYLTRLKVCHQIYLEAARIFYSRNQFDFIDVGVFGSDAWAALVAWIEVIGPLNTSCLKSVAMAFPDAHAVVSAGGSIPIPRHIMHQFTTRFDNKTFWQMNDVAPKACKLLVERRAKLQRFRLYFRSNRNFGDEECSKYWWVVEQIRKSLALTPEQMILEHPIGVAISRDFVAQGYKIVLVRTT